MRAFPITFTGHGPVVCYRSIFSSFARSINLWQCPQDILLYYYKPISCKRRESEGILRRFYPPMVLHFKFIEPLHSLREIPHKSYSNAWANLPIRCLSSLKSPCHTHSEQWEPIFSSSIISFSARIHMLSESMPIMKLSAAIC